MLLPLCGIAVVGGVGCCLLLLCVLLLMLRVVMRWCRWLLRVVAGVAVCCLLLMRLWSMVCLLFGVGAVVVC